MTATLTSTRRRLVPVVALATAMLLAAGCTPSDDGDDDATTETESSSDADEGADSADAEGDDPVVTAADVDPCGLLSADDVAGATGAEAEDGRGGTPASGEGALCEWTTDASEVSFVQLLVSDATAADVRAELDASLAEIAEDLQIDGAEDGYTLPGTAAAQIDEAYLEVSVVPEADGAAEELLRAAVAGLG